MFGKTKLLESENKALDAKVRLLEYELYRLKNEEAKVKTLHDNLDYLVEKGVLAGPVNESLVSAMKLGINLRAENFITSKEEIDKYFTE